MYPDDGGSMNCLAVASQAGSSAWTARMFTAVNGVRLCGSSLRSIIMQALTAATPAQIQPAPTTFTDPLPLAPLGVDGLASPSIAAVYAAQEFQDAFHAGVRDIEIYAHMDLRNLSVPTSSIITSIEGSESMFKIGDASPTTRSIRVCSFSEKNLSA